LWSADYVIFSNGHFLGVSEESIADITLFDNQTCVWTSEASAGGSGTFSMTVDGTTYYLTSSLTASSNSTDAAELYLDATGRQLSTASEANYLQYSESAWNADGTAADNCYGFVGVYGIQWGKQGQYYLADRGENYDNDSNKKYLNTSNTTPFCKWAILKYDADYSMLIHIPTGRFVLSNTPASNGDKAVHTETITAALGTTALFKIIHQNGGTGSFNIIPYGETRSFNSFGGGGKTIGLWNASGDKGSLWDIIDSDLEKPAISFDPSGKVHITSSITGAAIYYTVVDTQTGQIPTPYSYPLSNSYSAPFAATDGTYIKAIVVDPVTKYCSEVATKFYKKYETAGKYVIYDNGHFLSISGGNISTSTTIFTESTCVWSSDADGFLSIDEGGTTYYLVNTSGTLSLSTTKPLSGFLFNEVQLCTTYNDGTYSGYVQYSGGSWNANGTAHVNVLMYQNEHKFIQWNNNTSYYLAVSGNNYQSGKPYLKTSSITPYEQWVFLKEYDPTYTYIINISTGQFVVAHTKNNEKQAVHLESPLDITANGRFLITTNNTTYAIIPNGAGGGFNSWGGAGNDIGLYDSGNQGSRWNILEVILPAPIITIDDLGYVTITSDDASASYYYTTDGSSPSQASTLYTGSFQVASGTTVKAIAVRNGFNDSPVAEQLYVTATLAPPTITIAEDGTVTITHIQSGTTIRYTTDGTEPNSSSEIYNGSFTVESGKTVKAYATMDDYEDSPVASKRNDFYQITSLSEITIADGFYTLKADVPATSVTVLENFSGVLNGNYHQITGTQDTPLFGTLTDATVKNLFFENTNITSGNNSGNAGAIACEANGATRIYNCGVLDGSVTGTSNVGGLVGLLDGSARVINCFSFADINGGTTKGGIVGNNAYASKNNDPRTMVMNCMFYGDIAEGGSISPIYGGQMITNKGGTAADGRGLNNYNYFRFNKDYVTSITNYNCALGAQDRYLEHFEFYRYILNSNQELAAWYITGNVSDKEIMAKWVLDKSIAPYPILKKQGKYPSVINHDVENAEPIGNPDTDYNQGRKLGELSVIIQMGDGGAQFGAPTGASIIKSDTTLVITDKDPGNFDFNYRKVQLPYYNEVGTNNYTGNRVVTGWKIVSISGGTPGTFTGSKLSNSPADNAAYHYYPAYNFVDRKCTNKDLYSVTGRVFNQGAYWEVPDGVKSITIEPYWGKAAYLSDAYYDVVYEGSNATQVAITGNRLNSYKDQTVHHTMSEAISALSSNATHTVYDYAVVLIGNYHCYNGDNSFTGNNSNPLTVMSVDLDSDNEPDCSFFYQHSARPVVSPLRFDFLNIPGIGMAHKQTGVESNFEPGIFRPIGWFEITNTCLIHFSEFEYSDTAGGIGKKILSPTILMGGVYEQFVGSQNAAAGNIQFLMVGGNAWFKEFNNGCHPNADRDTPKRPIIVAGGEFKKFYLSGVYRPNWAGNNDNVVCYVDGGKFGEMAGAGMQLIKGDVKWFINGADIDAFYGGGINELKSIQGNIDVTISNSHVNLYCGGPKFGTMSTGKTVTTTASNCKFGDFFGAGYGGTSINRVGYQDETYSSTNNKPASEWNGWVDTYYKRKYTNEGIAIGFDYEYLFFSGGKDKNKVARFYINYASLSLAATRNVVSNLTGCKMTNFYGGGNLGFVNGDITSTLTNCEVTENVYGAGFSSSAPTTMVMNKTNSNGTVAFEVAPSYDNEAGVFNDEQVKYPQEVEYTWKHANSVSENNEFEESGGHHYILTTVNMNNLGTVSGNVTLNIVGSTTVHGDVYGGGALASSNTDYYKDSSPVLTTSTKVNLLGGTIEGDVYGGGLGRFAKDAVAADPEKGIEAEEAVEAVAALVGNTKVNLNGLEAGDYVETVHKDWVVPVKNDEDVIQYYALKSGDDVKGCVVNRIFGCNNINGTPKGTARVHVFQTQGDATHVRTESGKVDSATGSDHSYEVEAVYGGGNLSAYEPTNALSSDEDTKATAHTDVIIEGCDYSSIRQVYGGGNAASTPATSVTINGAYEIEEVFGGGNGKDRIVVNGVQRDNPGANVGFYEYADDAPNAQTPEDRAAYYQYGSGQAAVNIFGGNIHRVFGGSNTKGNVRKTAVTMLEEQNECFCVDEAYGGGKSAPMDAEAKLLMACIPGLKAAYGGAEAADIQGNVTLNITNGSFDRVFGGNNKSGTINGSITLNIEETGCRPVIIGELYGGGNEAAYSIYGYKTVNKGTEESPEYVVLPRESAEDDGTGPATPYADPQVNIKSFTRIGTVYGGGLGVTATMVGNPHVNINQVYGKQYDSEGEGKKFNVRATTLGTIGNVFGGGNQADVKGDTYVNIGTESKIDFATADTYMNETEPRKNVSVEGANITGDVFGGGNKAKVWGNTHVNIGKD